MLLASLMLLTGMLGQVGHAWAHGGGADPAAAWLAAMQAERDWLAGGAAGSVDASVQVFGAEGRHSHGDGPAHQHDGPDGLLGDHAHGVAFVLPAASGLAHRALGVSMTWALSARLAVSCTRFLWTPICPRRDRNDDVQHEADRRSFGG
jgi:hypothetical protein